MSALGHPKFSRLKKLILRLRHSRYIGRILSIALLLLISGLLVVLARDLDWQEVSHALRGYDLQTLLLAICAMIGSYGIYSTFDLIGRHYTGHRLNTRQVMTVGFISYAFNQTLTAWVGGIAARYRLYTRHQLDTPTIAQIFAISLLTNWMGFLVLAALMALTGALPIPPNWPLGTASLQLIGALLLIVLGVYAYWNYRYAGQSITRFNYQWRALGIRTTLLQVMLGASNWMLMATVIFVLLHQQVAYPLVLSILLLSAISTVVLHIPAGLGVVEGLFITLLHDKLPRGTIVAAMIAYRAIYYLMPLIPAALLYLINEVFAKRADRLRNANSSEGPAAPHRSR